VLGALLAASTAYLSALILGYVFGIADVQRHHIETASYIFAAAAAVTAFTRNRSQEPKRSPSTREWLPWLPLVLAFIAASGAVYGGSARLGLFCDDFVLVERALSRQWVAEWQFIRPVPSALWTLLLSSTETPIVLHALNIVLHGVNAALVYFVARRLDLPASAALVAGLLFLTFPSSVEAVVWPSAIHDLLVTTCALGFLLLSHGPMSLARAVAAIVVLVVALLSKESAIAIPVLAAILWIPFKEPRRFTGWLIVAAGAGVCAVYTVIRLVVTTIPSSYAETPGRYLAKELLARSIGTLTLPWASEVVDARPVIVALWAVAFVIAAATYAWARSRVVEPSVIVRCLVAVVISVLPVYSFFFISAELENARYIYLSTAFWVLAVAGLLNSRDEDWLRSPTSIVVGIALVSAVVGVQWHLRAWRDAAAVRERVLAAAHSVLETAPCPRMAFAGAPDSVRGAYVFRNGLAEATARRNGFFLTKAPADCVLVWDGSSFQRTANPSSPIQATLEQR
jgi:hypothetical protein